MGPKMVAKATQTYGAPRGLASDVGGLPFWREDAEWSGGRQSKSVCSVWTFTDEERQLIANGADIVLKLYSEPIPPILMGVYDEEKGGQLT